MLDVIVSVIFGALSVGYFLGAATVYYSAVKKGSNR